MNWTNPIIAPILPALVIGFINYLYNRKKGYTHIGSLILGVIAFYAIFYLVLKLILKK
jgi:hypothetical protein